MDVFSHFVLPFLAAWALRRPFRERLAAGVGGVAPDADALTAFLGLLDDRIWFLGHRGVSHSLLGAPVYALGVAAVLSLPYWGRRWPRLQALRFDARMLAVALAFSYTHLALDAVTMWGVPLLFPWTLARFSVDWYFYSVAWALPLSAGFLWLLWRRAPERRLRQVGVALVVVLLVSGGARLAWRPAAPDAIRTFPAGMEWRWATIHEVEGGYEVRTYSLGKPLGSEIFPHEAPASVEEAEALRLARASPLAKGFHLYAGWPVAVLVERAGEDAWNVTFTDLMRRAQFVDHDGFLPLLEEFGVLRLRVDEAGVRERD